MTVVPVGSVTQAFIDHINVNFAALEAAQAVNTVERFGGVGDGVTDDTVAFGLALADGRPIMLDGKKSYAIQSLTVPFDSDCPGISAWGGRARIVAASGSTLSTSLVRINKASDFAVENIVFDMPASTSTVYALSCALRFQPTTDFTGTNYRVENCGFSGGGTAITSVGYILKNSRFAGNYATNTYGDTFSFNALINVEIVDNAFEDCGIGTTGSTPSGVIRAGTDTQREASYNLTISRNRFARCCEATGQSVIDCYSGSASGLRIEENIAEDCGGGIELKTYPWVPTSPSVPTRPETYSDIVIATNTLRAKGGRNAGGISVFHAEPGLNPAGKCRDIHIFANKLSCIPAFVPGSGFNSYGITLQGYNDSVLDSNKVDGFDKGILISGIGAISDTCSNVTVSRNAINGPGTAILHGGGTINGLYIFGNQGRSTDANTVLGSSTGAATTDLQVMDNYFEGLVAAGYCVDLRGVDGARLFRNTFIADLHAIYFGTSPMNDVQVIANALISATSHAVRFDFGTLLQVRNNEIDVPIGFRAVATGGGFAGSFTAAGNVRGMASANPTGFAGGSLGDIFLDDTAATAGWRCTTAGGIGVAVYTEI